jgi:hypothetical protein
LERFSLRTKLVHSTYSSPDWTEFHGSELTAKSRYGVDGVARREHSDPSRGKTGPIGKAHKWQKRRYRA